ncbi:SDR family NAD(P)-dependent oxidoreductase [Burkholderia gladioli]|uniref:SDR family NAD(P)-dependent oxidoreductase n=1 Tax=Burkholderia gladioli TaxID=28095 RepID=UPI003D21CFDD
MTEHADQTNAREVVKPVEAAGRKAVALRSDISDEAFCQRLAGEAVAKLGSPDILVNVAGKQAHVEKVGGLHTKQLKATFRANVFAISGSARRPCRTCRRARASSTPS